MSSILDSNLFDLPDGLYHLYPPYLALRRLLPGRRVLELQCGSGEGARLLADGLAEELVASVRDEIGADLSTVSKHLSVLKNAGLVEVDKRGLQVYYRLRCPCILRFFDCIESVLQENAKKHRALMAS